TSFLSALSLHDALPIFRFSSLWRKAREPVAEVGFVEFRVFTDLSRQKSSAEGAVRNKTDPELLERRQHFFFGPSPPERVFALERSEEHTSELQSLAYLV